MAEETIIKIENISKSFYLSKGINSLKNYFLSPFQALSGTFRKNRLTVLDDVSFEVHRGEFIGVIGRNGSGKSTLLKLIAGIYTPDKGKIIVRGKIVPFLELGVGFNPELTGKENIYLNGVILGMTKEYISRKYKDIVEFAELEKFMDTPVKNYSSGMLVRLAFSIAIQTDADIYILDEILAVGDALFQQKSAEIIRELVERGKTILFVSHDFKSVEKYCQKAIWIEKGRLRYFGKTDVAINMYQTEILKKEEEEIKKRMGRQEQAIEENKQPPEVLKLGSLEVEVHSVDAQVLPDRSIKIVASLKHNKPVEKLNVVFGLYKDTGEYVTAFGTNMDSLDVDESATSVSATLQQPNLLGGRYYINIAVFGDDESQPYYWQKRVGVFYIEPQERYKKYRGSVYFQHEWEIE